MSVLIRGIEAPKNCKECPLGRMDDIDFDYVLYCTANKKYADLDMYDHPIGWNCPIAEVPTPHGRLIDADALINELASEHVGGLEAIKKYTNADTWTAGLHTAWRTIDDAPTVIEAEGMK